MYKILSKEKLNPQVGRMVIEAPLAARRAQPGQFVILRVGPEGERIPLTIADSNPAAGAITVIYQILGATTLELDQKLAGEFLQDVAGPLGKPTPTEGVQKAAVVIGGVGAAIGYPVAKKLHSQGAAVDVVAGFRNKDLVILEPEFRAAATRFFPMSDDGTWGEKGLVTHALGKLLEAGEHYDEVFVIGPLPMMKFVSLLTQQHGVKTTVSMNSIMIDGTGMCGCCRLSVGGEMKFACVDGPDFDGHLIDYDEAIARSRMYCDAERPTYEEACHLLAQADTPREGA